VAANAALRANVDRSNRKSGEKIVNNTKMPMPVMSFRIDRNLAGKLRGAAKHTGLRASKIVQDAVALHIEKLEKKAKKPFPVVAPRKYGK
jgi:hypothetical protein